MLTPHLAADPNSKGAAGSFEKLAQYVPARIASMRSQLPAAPPPPTPSEPDQIHVGDLDGSAVAGPQRTWAATITVTIHDYVHGANVAGANVAGSWSGGVDGDTGCVTDAAGQCSLTAVVSKKNLKKITFTVDGVSARDSTYIAGFNHDVDGDSDGNSIAVSRP